jgi:hypothetical protein
MPEEPEVIEVKEELVEICQGKTNFEENVENLIEDENLEEQKDLDNLQEVITNNLYTKDLTQESNEDGILEEILS